MPIYEYQCQRCGHELEAMQKMSEEPLKVCPECGESALQKLISAAGFQLKGSGWYVTDFRDKGKKKDTKTGDAAKTDSKSETKPDTKADTKASGGGGTD